MRQRSARPRNTWVDAVALTPGEAIGLAELLAAVREVVAEDNASPWLRSRAGQALADQLVALDATRGMSDEEDDRG